MNYMDNNSYEKIISLVIVINIEHSWDHNKYIRKKNTYHNLNNNNREHMTKLPSFHSFMAMATHKYLVKW